jgi:CBS domain containing-hemolysin-like protein
VTWNDIVEWAIAHPYISTPVVVLVIAGLLMKLAEQFPRLVPVMRVVGVIFAILVGSLILFVWIIPGIYEATAAHSRLENAASIMIILLAFILLALFHVVQVLDQIRKALEQ